MAGAVAKVPAAPAKVAAVGTTPLAFFRGCIVDEATALAELRAWLPSAESPCEVGAEWGRAARALNELLEVSEEIEDCTWRQVRALIEAQRREGGEARAFADTVGRFIDGRAK